MDIINQSKRTDLIIYTSTIFIFFYFIFLAPNNLTELLLNDNNTAVYSVYARNLIEYSLDKTFLLMSEIGPDGKNIFEKNDNTINRYINHPPLLIWLTSISYKLFGYEIIYGRMISIISSCLFFLVFFRYLVYIKIKLFYILSTIIVLLSLPVYWTHGLIIEHQPLLNLFLLLTSINFLEYIFHNKQKNFNYFLFFWTLSFLTDWPAYLFLIPYTLIAISNKNYKILLILISYPLAIYISLNLYHHYSINDLNLSDVLGIDLFYSRTTQNLFPNQNFFEIWGNSIFKMSYLFVHFNFKLIISFIFIISVIYIFFNHKKTNQKIFSIFICFFLPSLIYMLIFRMWAESHSYWSYYFITPILTSFIIFLDCIKKRYIKLLVVIISINFLLQFFIVSKDIMHIKKQPLSQNTKTFIEKYNKYDYVTDDESIGYGFAFRSRWLENKKFNNINLYKNNNNKVLFIKRLSNCTFEDNSFIKFEFFNWCYKELKQ